jgi:hypothetical protein
MQRRMSVVAALILGMALAGSAVSAVHAQNEKKKTKPDRVAGTVEVLNKESKTIVVKATGGNADKQVVYDDNTKFTKDNKPGKLEDVQNGVRIICLGTLNDKGQLMASRVDVRPLH